MEALAYYNEIDPFAAQWLRNLIDAGLIAPGVVDTRSVEEVTPNDLKGFRQVHLFAGIGGWSRAMRVAGWPDSRPAWTASCPCQPFSRAGKGKGFDDERHLWPAAHWLTGQSGPVVIFGEQSSGKDAEDWLDLVQTDMESLGYAFGATSFPSAGVGAPHIRERTYWLADSDRQQCEERLSGCFESYCQKAGGAAIQPSGHCVPDGMGHACGEGWKRRLSGRQDERRGAVYGYAGCDSADSRPGPVNGFWGAADWLFCRDGKWRPVKPGLKPVVNGVPGRVGKLRASGNAINIYAAALFIQSYMELRP